MYTEQSRGQGKTILSWCRKGLHKQKTPHEKEPMKANKKSIYDVPGAEVVHMKLKRILQAEPADNSLTVSL